jgi:hypothetical protein
MVALLRWQSTRAEYANTQPIAPQPKTTMLTPSLHISHSTCLACAPRSTRHFILSTRCEALAWMPAAVSSQLNAPTTPSFIVMRETLTSSRAVRATGSMVLQSSVRTSLLKKWCCVHQIVGIGLAARSLVKSWLHSTQHACLAPRIAASI